MPVRMVEGEASVCAGGGGGGEGVRADSTKGRAAVDDDVAGKSEGVVGRGGSEKVVSLGESEGRGTG